ncbi:unnamed protein product [Larinioides sclopetarius]|uniref:Uncharacterized protein n=1 Tax=Larinioides sclopetarius TaxID=280406 RepID=A0AAV1ZRM5_9ARAC
MAACTDTEEKPSSPKENSPVEIHLKNAVNHEMRKNCYNELCNTSKNSDSVSEKTEKSKPDVNTLSEDEFLQLMIEASTFNKSSKQESALLKQLRSDNPITDTEPSDKAALFKNSSQFSVHRNSKHTIGTNSSSFNSSSCYLRTSDSRKKHSRNKDDSSSKSALNLNVLQKGIHQSQSLQDLMSSDLSKSKQKSHKAHRTHSLSSDEVTGIETDSLIIPKSGKKSYKQSTSGTNSSKSEVNKSKNISKSSRSSDLDTIRLANKIQSNSPKDCSNYQSLSDSDIPTSNSQKEKNIENTAIVNSPVEIEMEEIKSDKKSSKGEESLCGKELEKSMNGPVESNSKFYIDCHDIDSTVSFPLKLVSGIEDQNNRAMSEGMKFPNVPWPRPIQVQSFFSSLPMDTDSFGSRSEKQILNADINGNPFGRASRSSNIASFVSSQLSEYGNGNLASETKNRKNKRLRNSVNKGVLAEHIAGHRGQEDIDDLVQYIMSDTDKKKGNAASQIVLNKNSLLHENERKKSVSKEIKNFQKNSINTAKKKLTRSNSMENMTSSTMTSGAESLFISEPEPAMNVKDTKVNNPEEKIKNLDINSNEESKFAESVEKSDNSADESKIHNCMGRNSPDISSFASDFYSTSNVSSQTTEDTGFSVVKKKQRKKQGKRSESYRWRNPQNQRKKGMMLTLAESKCGKQDSRRKSTSSVPHSDHSSADNSDLDSVHSLPVRGSAPHQTQPHPHTTPSSSSSTPQASYADIARMPISKLNSTSPNIAYSFVKPHSGGEEVKRTDGNSMSSVKRKVSDSREPSLVVKGISRSPASEKESDIATSDVKVRSQAKSTREINTQTEPENIIPDISKLENLNIRNKKADESPKTLCSSCSRKGNCSCSKSHPSSQKPKNTNIPPVIMDNMPTESDLCNFSFGFGVEEVLQMTPTKKASSPCLDKGQKNKDVEASGKSEGTSEVSNVNSKISSVDINFCSKGSSSSDVLKTVHSHDLKHEQSSHLKTLCIRGGKNIHFAETEFNDKKFNQTEVVSYFGNGTANSSKVKYYEDSSEEA